jgi:hypothetical protein
MDLPPLVGVYNQNYFMVSPLLGVWSKELIWLSTCGWSLQIELVYGFDPGGSVIPGAILVFRPRLELVNRAT